MIIISTQCFPPDIGGIEVLMGQFAHYLSYAGNQVTVFADRSRDIQKEEPQLYTTKRFGGFRPVRRWLKAQSIDKLISQSGYEPKWIIADSWKSLETLKTNCPTLVLAHGNELLFENNAKKKVRIQRSLSKADLVLANSHYSAEKVMALGISKAHIRVFNPPSNPQEIPNPDSLNEVNLIIDQNHPIITTVARLEPRKGIDRVLESIPTLIKKYPKILYLIGGAGPDQQRLQNIMTKLGIEKHVAFLGRIDVNIRSALLSRSDIFVMPTRTEGNSVEGFGISYIDAAWFGVPSIASREGGAPDAVIDGTTGLILDDTSVPTVTHALTLLLENDALRIKFGEAAAKRSRNELSWPNQVSVLMGHLIEAQSLYKIRASR